MGFYNCFNCIITTHALLYSQRSKLFLALFEEHPLSPIKHDNREKTIAFLDLFSCDTCTKGPLVGRPSLLDPNFFMYSALGDFIPFLARTGLGSKSGVDASLSVVGFLIGDCGWGTYSTVDTVSASEDPTVV
jgi:hypothetical protein